MKIQTYHLTFDIYCCG